MKLFQWTLFIDMLGYRDINGEISDDESASEFISFMELNKELLIGFDSQKSRDHYAKFQSFNLYEFYEIKYAFVSDSIIITYVPQEVNSEKHVNLKFKHSANALFIILMRLQILIFHCFTEKNIFLRGGISNGFCAIKDGFVVGEGLIDAYIAESKKAKNPRIVLSERTASESKIMSSVQDIANEMYNAQSIIKKDDDGLFFLDYLGYLFAWADENIPMVRANKAKNPQGFNAQLELAMSYVSKHANIVRRSYSEIADKISNLNPDNSEELKTLNEILKKYEWLKNYHNNSVRGRIGFDLFVIE